MPAPQESILSKFGIFQISRICWWHIYLIKLSMSEPKIIKLTHEQEALIPVYQNKWRQKVLSTERINRDKATQAIKEAYVLMDFGLDEPKIIFCDSPYAAQTWLINQASPERIEDWLQNPDSLGSLIASSIHQELVQPLSKQLISYDAREKIGTKLDYIATLERSSHEIFNNLIEKLYNQIQDRTEGLSFYIEAQLNDCFQPETHINWVAASDFCISVLGLAYRHDAWETFKSIEENCGWIFACDEFCLICEKPLKYNFDDNNQLHAEGEAAVEFADGYSLYAYHGAVLPEKYGKLHPKDWKAQWLLEEDNAELRRVLIQGIGYARILEELQAVELDSYKEYTLLKIDSDVDIEPIYLLKMICPSTKHIHILRVPPNIESAQAAITWVNCNIPPEDFSQQT